MIINEFKKNSKITIGLLIDWTEEPYQNSIFNGIVDFAEENDVNLLCFVAGGLESPREYEKTRNVLYDMVNEKNIDGLIITSGSIGNYVGNKAMNEFCKKYDGIPLISIALELDGTPSVLCDNKKGIHDAIIHLIEKHGYKKIAFIRGPESNTEAEDRYYAYIDVIKQYGIEFDPRMVVNGNFELESGIDAVKILLDSRNVNFEAIIAANDNMALGAMEELQKRDINMSRKIAIIGFDDLEMGKYAVLPLTTVRQPLYEQGKTAASMAVRLVKKGKIPGVIKLPARLIIRESCGCFSNNTINADSGEYYVINGLFEEIIIMQKESILEELLLIRNSISGENKDICLKMLTKSIDCFFSDIFYEKNKTFLKSWNETLSYAILKGFDISVWHNVLSELRKNIIPCIINREILVKTEDLLQQARVLLGEAVQRAETFQKILTLFNSQQLREIGDELMTAFDVDQQMNIIYKELPRLGIKSCYLSLYDNPEHSLKYSNLILAFNENERISIPKDGIKFLTENLVPPDILSVGKRYNFIIEELSDGNDHLGLVLFEIEPQDGKIYEILRNRLSSALKVAILINKIRKQTENLETQVKERTLDLTKTNDQLQKEILEKEKVEEKLREALNNLEIKNKELRSLSLKDDLTELYNRRGFLTLGEQHLKLVKRLKKDFILFFIDLDGLKIINDSFGHKEGDYVIIKTAEILKYTFRQADIIARIGGDEFTVLSVETSLDDEREIIKRLQKNIEKYNQNAKKPYDLSMSIGYSHFFEGSSASFEELMAEADKKLYEEKKNKKSDKNEDI